MFNKKERKEAILKRIDAAKNTDFIVKKISFDSPLDVIKNTAPNVLKKHKK